MGISVSSRFLHGGFANHTRELLHLIVKRDSLDAGGGITRHEISELTLHYQVQKLPGEVQKRMW